jgi:sortase A
MMRSRSPWRALVLVALIGTAACSSGPQDDPAVLGVGFDQVVDTSAAPTTVTPTTVVATSAAAATAPPTVVETLPQPVTPPEPRAVEPYIELGTIEIPALGISEPLLEGITLTTLDKGPGHWPGTAMPGKLGNVVVAGHRTSFGRVFRHIDDLVPGDEVIFTTTDGRFRYLVTETTIVAPDALYVVEQTEAHTATLFACHPPGSTRQRIVVHLTLDA